MHYHLEIIMPPVEDVQAAVTHILKPFEEGEKDADGHLNHAFWDWWVIGGRWAGAKLEAEIGRENLDRFQAALTERNVTVSSFQAGKATLSPANQVPMVDALWNEMFPDSPVRVCPLFDHFNDQYAKDARAYGDIMCLKDMPSSLTACHVIIAGPTYLEDGTLEARHMVQESIWNGVCHLPVRWDGKVQTAIDEYLKKLEIYKPDWRAKQTPQNDWLVVTVDYHN